MKDFDSTHFTPMKRICEAVRIQAQVTHNSAFGREKADMIDDVQRLVRFPWEQPRIQTVEQMKNKLLGMAMSMGGVKVTQKGEPVEVTKKDKTMKRTK